MSAKSKKSQALGSNQASIVLADRLEAVRLEITRAQDRWLEVNTAPVSIEEATARVETWTRRLRDDALSRLDPERFTAVAYRQPTPTDSLDLLLGVASHLLRDEIVKRLAETYEAGRGFGFAERQAELAALQDEVLRFEVEEEEIIREAEAAGLNFLRRPTADPRAVLAMSEDEVARIEAARVAAIETQTDEAAS